jgi:hypothetical protein
MAAPTCPNCHREMGYRLTMMISAVMEYLACDWCGHVWTMPGVETVQPWHSAQHGETVYHDQPDCPNGHVDYYWLRHGTGDRPRCTDCARLDDAHEPERSTVSRRWRAHG